MREHIVDHAAASAGVRRISCAFGSDLWAGGCRRPGVAKFGRVALCEQHFQEVAAKERTAHWEEVDLLLEAWLLIATAWENETLLRLLSYARLEADTERELEHDAVEDAARARRLLP